MNLCIIKRNGDIKPFDKEKIILAISKAIMEKIFQIMFMPLQIRLKQWQ